MVTNALLDFFYGELPPGPLQELQQQGYFVDEHLPDDATWDFEPCLYNQLYFLALKPGLNLQSFYLIQVVEETFHVRALIRFGLSGAMALSLPGAPHGGPDVASSLPAEILSLFLQQVVHRLQQAGVNKTEVRLPASGIFNRFAEVKSLLQQLGFRVSQSEINHHLPGSDEVFPQHLHASAKRRLRKLQRHGFVFEEEPPANAAEVFAFIEACRKQKEYSLSLSWPAVEQALRQLPGRYFFFSVRQNGQLAAATLAVLAAEGVLYNYAPAHAPEYDAFSPVILLTEGLVKWCRQKGLQTLDLGTSTLEGQPNLPLITFKERLGGIASEKTTLVKLSEKG